MPYTYYLEVGVKATESEDNKGKSGKLPKKGDTNDFKETTNISKKEEKLEKLVILFEPHTWPGKAATPSKAPPKPTGLNKAPL